MARVVSGPEITGQVVSRQTGSPIAGATVTVSATVYTDPDFTSGTTTLTANGRGEFFCYAGNGTYTFTTTAPGAAPIESVTVRGTGGGGSQSGAYAASGAWAAGTTYPVHSTVTFGRVTYVAETAHTAGTYFLTDLLAGKWFRVGEATPTRSQTLASLGDSIACNGANPSMAVTTLAAAANAGDTTISVNAPAAPGAITDYNGSNGYLIKVGSEYTKLSTSNASGAGPYTLTLEGGIGSNHTAGETVYGIPTYFNQGAPPPALVASIVSDGKVRFAGVYGRGSATAQQLRDTYLPLVVAAKPGYCYVMAGRNNIGADGAVTAIGVLTFIWDTLLAAGITPVATTIPPANSQTAAARNADKAYNAAILREAGHRGLPVDDFYAAMVDPSTGDYTSGYTIDGTHPGAAQRYTQGANIWTALSATGRFAGNPTPFPSTSTYPDATVHVLPAVNTSNNALMLTGGGQSTGSGSTSDVPLGWSTSVVDAVAVVSRPVAPRGNGKALKIARAAGGTAGSTQALVQTLTNFTVVAGHRYQFVARVKSNGVAAAKTADAGFSGWGCRISHQNFSSKLSWFGVDTFSFADTDGAISVDFIAAANGPLSLLIMLTLQGTAATPAYDVTFWDLDVIDLDTIGEAASSVFP